MSSQDKASKTEKATPKKIKDARKEGQVAKSPEVSAWLTTFAMTLLLPWSFSRGQAHVESVAARVPALIADPDQGLALGLFADGLRGAVFAVLPLAFGLLAVGVAANLAQVGFTPSPKALKPKLNRLNPLPGIKRLFGAKSLWMGCKELIKLALLAGLAYWSLSRFIPDLIGSGQLTLPAILARVVETAVEFLRNAALLGLVLAAADYAMQKKQHAKELRMSLKDIKDENKNADGDPQMKAAVRERQMRISRNRMMADVASADVVLVNPTHVAVALKYDAARGAPRVVAKGSGAIAAKIRERATENRVPLVKDVPLARALHKACEIGDEIPADLYAAVAQVLAFLFALKARGASAGTHVVPQRALTG